jgi:hypothetical protein
MCREQSADRSIVDARAHVRTSCKYGEAIERSTCWRTLPAGAKPTDRIKIMKTGSNWPCERMCNASWPCHENASTLEPGTPRAVLVLFMSGTYVQESSRISNSLILVSSIVKCPCVATGAIYYSESPMLYTTCRILM